ncbi:hypothetical protein EDI_278110 [Entamoeba dispar SAW760]|uniref:Transmembrane protein n=1 Tax=Entamoeba dispar (strain ATCC PRA-260 / SAW760) TaxID=370354 RepID=B0ECU8_ENTDS|nr:uncharacterized protein EDI_278110 [Entamoeba dispar SAW760]EDR27640.1 hypothetical protein EDI_278110 [Entamoeba dispar SAW760]|eukprot:EDR27640.1 hypothetical protein EDI_278110 [Entamoeba dispar SAW760]
MQYQQIPEQPQYTQQTGYQTVPPQYNPQPYIVQPNVDQQEIKSSYSGNNESTTSALLFALGFLCCCVWCYGWCQYRHSTNDQARMFAILSMVFFLVSTIIIVISIGFSFVMIFISVAAAAATTVDPY